MSLTSFPPSYIFATLTSFRVTSLNRKSKIRFLLRLLVNSLFLFMLYNILKKLMEDY